MSDPTITDAELDEWERLANEATPGPWEATPAYDDPWFWVETVNDGGYPVCGIDASREADANYIAAANPATMRRLTAALRAERALMGRYAPLLKVIDALHQREVNDD